MPLNLSNNIESGTEIRAAEHEQNYTEIENYVNSNLLHADGSVPINNGVQLILGAAGTSPSAAVTRQQLDDAITAFNSGLSSTASNAADADHNHDGVYSPVAHTHPYAASSHTHNYSRLALCVPTRIFGSSATPVSAGSSVTVTVPATVGGVSTSGIVGVVANVAAQNPLGPGFLRLRSTSDAWQNAASVNYATAATTSNLVLTKVNGSRQFQVNANNNGVGNVIVDVFGLVF